MKKLLLSLFGLALCAGVSLAQPAYPFEQGAVKMSGGNFVPSGTVTSVNVACVAEMNCSGGPVVGSGTITQTWASITSGYFLARDFSGSGVPSFQALTLTDGQCLGRTGTAWASKACSGGSVATDTIWDAAGDLVQGTGADTAAKLSAGAVNGYLLTTNGAAAAVAWKNPYMATNFIGGTEEFIQNQLNNCNANGGTSTGVDDPTNPTQGLQRFTITTTASSNACIGWNRGSTGGRPLQINTAGGVIEFACRLGAVSALSDATDRYVIRCGYEDQTASEPPSGFYIKYTDSDSANWRFCASNGTEACTTTGTAVSTSAMFEAYCTVNAAYNSFSCVDKNGSSLGSAVTTNFPTTRMGVNVSMKRTAGTTNSRTMDVDYVRWSVQLTTAR